MNPSERIHSLDVLRGLAVLLVLCRHLPETDASAPIRVLQAIGWTGVDLFFVLSGFLISGLLFQEFNRRGEIDVKRFWLRRGLKIWPSYFFTYGCAMLLTAIATGNVDLLRTRFPNYVFMQNYADPAVRWTHSWSIAIEEHFYLILPLLLVVTAPGRFKNLFKIGFGLCICVLLARVVVFVVRDPHWANFYYPSHLRFDSLFFGVLLGYFYQYRRNRFLAVGRWWPVLVATVPLLGMAYAFPLETSGASYTIGFTVFYITFGGLVVAARTFPDVGRNGLSKIIALVGVYSYTIYLAHSVLYELPGATHVRRAVVSTLGHTGDRLLFVVASIILGVLISHTIERPFLKLRAKWFPSRPASQRVRLSKPIEKDHRARVSHGRHRYWQHGTT